MDCLGFDPELKAGPIPSFLLDDGCVNGRKERDPAWERRLAYSYPCKKYWFRVSWGEEPWSLALDCHFIQDKDPFGGVSWIFEC